MPSVLAIESSTPHASLVLWKDGVIAYEGGFESDRHHNALLFKPLQEAVEVLGKHSLDVIIVGTGPGSYSGTRVGIAAGQGLALVHECPVVGLSSLLALGIHGGIIIGDARRGSSWMASIGEGLPDPQIVDSEKLPAMAGDQVYALEDVSKLNLPESIKVTLVKPTARFLIEAWNGLDKATREKLAQLPPQPAYLRPPHITEAKKGHPLLRK